MSTKQNSSASSLHDLTKVILAVKIISELIADPSHHNDLIEQGLTEDVVVSITRKD